VPEQVVLLHGFGGTRRAWDGVASRLDPESYLPVALDLPGHGELSDAQPTFAACVESVLERAPSRFVLCGYSLGGRIALHVALAAPARVSRLVLVSCSAGIDDPAERAARRASDEQLAQALETEPYERFLERWNSQPLFAADPGWVGELARAEEGRNRPQALAAVLRGIGTGAMAPLWDRLISLKMPASVVVGERDDRYVELGRRMAVSLANAELHVVPGGHRLALENPDALAVVLATGPAPARAPTAR
jgi:2-succinyl-6-hydroxy-2,4-cyclohexadiene-1-carboxylate synthase